MIKVDILKTSKELVIHPSSGEYAKIFHAWRSQPNMLNHNPIVPIGINECRERLDNEVPNLAKVYSGNNLRWFLEKDGSIVASFSLNNVNAMILTAEIGYEVDEVYQGQGIGAKTVYLLIDKIFAETNLRKLIAYVHDKNIASCKILEKLKFTREGFLREHYLINGHIANEVVYGLLRDDWENR